MQMYNGRLVPQMAENDAEWIMAGAPGWFHTQERFLRSLPLDSRHTHWDWLLRWLPSRTHALAFRFEPLTVIWGLSKPRRGLITNYFKLWKTKCHQPTLHRYFKVVRKHKQVSIRRYIRACGGECRRAETP